MSIYYRSEDRPRVLCISPFFAPLANAEAFCGGKIALHLLDAGVDVTVLAVDYARHPKFAYDSSPLWRPLEAITMAIPPHGGRSKFLSAPLGLRYCSADWARWIAATVAAATSIHRERPFDVIYSRGIPNVAHVVGYWIQRATELPWVANFNDPWDLEGAHLLPQHRKQRKRTARLFVSDLWLKRVLRTATMLTFPCSRLRDYHLRLGTTRGRTAVIPHIGAEDDRVDRADRFQLVHAGNLGCGESTRRNATTSLLHAFRGLLEQRPSAHQRARLSLVGPQDGPTLTLAEQLGLAGVVMCSGKVSYAESLRRIAAASTCLLVEGNMPEGIYLPSKFADYIRAAKPVIALSPSVGTIADLLPRRGLTQVCVDDTASIEAALIRHFDAFENGRLGALTPEPEFTEMFDGGRIAERLKALFKSLAGTPVEPAYVG